MKDIVKAIIEGVVVSQGKPVGSRGLAFRASSSSNASRTDEPGKHSHGVDIGASRNYAHEKAAKEKAEERMRKREQEVEKRTKEAEQRKKEVAKMASEEHIEEAKGTWVQDKPLKAHVAAMEKRDTEDLKGMHSRWSGDHKDKKSDPDHSERLLAVHHVLKKRGVSVPDLPQHRNLGMMRRFTAEEVESSGTKARVKIKNVARLGDAEPTSEKSTLGKTGSIKTKIIEEKPLMSDKNFGLPASLIAAARQIVEKKHDDNDNGDAKKMAGGKTAVIIDPETDDKINEGEPKKKHTVPVTDKHKKLAALAHPKDKITHKDVLVGRGVINKEEMSSKEKMKRGLYRKEEVELEEGSVELKPSEFHSVRTGKKSIEDLAKEKKADVGRVRGEYKTHADHWSKGEANYNKLFKEDVQLSAAEKARIEELAKSFPAEVDEAVKKSVPMATTAVSAPLRGANQDYSGVGTKSSVADYTISDSKKMKMKEEEALDEISKKTMWNYAMDAKGEIERDRARAGKPDWDYTHKDLSPEQIKRHARRMKGLSYAAHKISGDPVPDGKKIFSKEDVELDEVSDELKKSYVRAASKDATLANMAKRHSGSEADRQTWAKREMKRKAGLSMALKKEEVDLEEGRGRPRKNPLPPGKEPEGDDTHKHPMQQLEKISHSMEGNEPHFEHKDGSKSKITKHLAKHIVAIHNSMRTTQEKDNFAQKVHANRDSLRSEVSKHF